MIREIKNWWFLRQNDYPSPDEVRILTAKTPLRNLKILGYAITYCETQSIEETALLHSVTRERVRQCLLKLRRSVMHVDRNV